MKGERCWLIWLRKRLSERLWEKLTERMCDMSAEKLGKGSVRALSSCLGMVLGRVW